MGIKTVESHRIKGCGQAFGIRVLRQSLKATVGFKGVALTGKHTGRIFAFTLKGKYTGGVGKLSGQIFTHQPLEQFTVIFKAR